MSEDWWNARRRRNKKKKKLWEKNNPTILHLSILCLTLHRISTLCRSASNMNMKTPHRPELYIIIMKHFSIENNLPINRNSWLTLIKLEKENTHWAIFTIDKSIRETPKNRIYRRMLYYYQLRAMVFVVQYVHHHSFAPICSLGT